MIRPGLMIAVSVLALSVAPARAAEPIAVPSGQAVEWVETIHDAPGPSGLTIRFRFLAPQIGGSDPIDPDQALVDMEHLCTTFALPRIVEPGPQPAQIIISLSDRPVLFGATDPEATQYFEAFRPEGGVCIWEIY
ncbi:DUF6497 family protein [Phaeovulum veldkampii]|nr:DUF6497 family protein [Phaeovulum veldkampii]TDQ56122.1 hypothetical protein EV658_12224 [Phaeovulum veldkampii DSM 11550]